MGTTRLRSFLRRASEVLAARCHAVKHCRLLCASVRERVRQCACVYERERESETESQSQVSTTPTYTHACARAREFAHTHTHTHLMPPRTLRSNFLFFTPENVHVHGCVGVLVY
jgi:hypothetical protein